MNDGLPGFPFSFLVFIDVKYNVFSLQEGIKPHII